MGETIAALAARLVAEVIAVEGGYVNHPADPGGATNFGITQAVARAHGYAGDMRALPRATAAAIYLADYWALPHFDLVAALSAPIAAELFDTGVNCGVAVGVQFLQRGLNVLAGAKLKTDGGLTPDGATLRALAAYLRARPADGEANLLKLLNCFQGERYADLVERKAKNLAFINGWIANRVELPR